MPGLTFSNELISRDESMHVEFACWLHSTLQTKLSEHSSNQLVVDAVALEKKFWVQAFPDPLLVLSSEPMQTYIEFVADTLLTMLGSQKLGC